MTTTARTINQAKHTVGAYSAERQLAKWLLVLTVLFLAVAGIAHLVSLIPAPVQFAGSVAFVAYAWMRLRFF